MKPTISREDTLPHVAYSEHAIDADDPNNLFNQVSSTAGRIVIISAFGCSLVLNYYFEAAGLHVDVTLETPVGNKTLINADLNPSNPEICVGGSINGFKAEACVALDFSTMELVASGEVCAPVLGCKKGAVTIHV
jgi:hypothetical protein